MNDKYNNPYKIAIITPVYNRKKDLERLFQSLNCQTNKHFVWLIIDDGSFPTLKSIVSKWRKTATFIIFYHYQNNMGKMHAYKNAVNLINTDWSIVVDSDDWVDKNTISILDNVVSELSNKNIGIVFPKRMRNDDSKKWKNVPSQINLIALRYQYGIKESAILLRHSVLIQAFSKLKLPSEKFISEEILYNYLIKKGRFKTNSNIFYNAEYQIDGLTNNVFNLWLKSPQSTLMLLKSRYESMSTLPFKFKIVGKVKTILNLNAFCLVNKNNLWVETPNRVLSTVLFLPSLLFKEVRFNGSKRKNV
ncbi:Abequosyltransferase RfbV [Lactobacillus helveticus]|uniref:glycosyltransferase family A protein n=1 Tax=Lactobacillus helveticus TaxID=1587 RepID=UPI0015622A1A|nr:glycosyltransferase family A protein [Lactobacillus helveticus]NRO65234.1 Abequosyltransferase RfbV [Lactobacillus helveticus]NRO79287.1 Abequosyltransferase RfbV [Lactobacillus helveticus]